MRRASAVAIAALVCLLSAGAAHGTDGRAYLKRANALAGDGKCAAAVKDYTKAYEKLKDPIVLFNRAECYRRLGENNKAIQDYQGYLKGFPKAPNRADIENKIATLSRPAAPPPPPVAARPPAATRPPAPTLTAPPPPAATRPPPPPPPSVARPTAPPPPVAVAPPPRAPAPPPEPMPFLPPPPGTGGETTLVEAPRTETKDTAASQKDEASGSRWWLWTALAVVVVGGGVAGYLLLRPKDEPPPPTSLGHYRF
jgi:hypothetical protein